MSTISLPPYGHLEEVLNELIKEIPLSEAWRAVNGDNSLPKFQRWLDEVTQELDDLLWPVFDTAKKDWSRPPDLGLIEADLDLMDKLRDQLGKPIDGLGDPPTTHLDFFHEEDGERFIGSDYQRYDPGLPGYLQASLQDFLFTAQDRLLGSVQFQIKARMQRPRAYQVAMILGREFHHDWAKTGGSPAMISGHSIQGVMAGCAAYLLFGNSVGPVSLRQLKQFTVDIGDRRVFAGVHYPSDNISSWYTAFRLLPFVLEHSALPGVKAFLWDAIENRSYVYAAVRAHMEEAAKSGSESPFAKSVKALQRLAGVA